MPPLRVHDNHIPLKPGSSPVSKRPCKYHQVHKVEIERLVKEMLEDGIM